MEGFLALVTESDVFADVEESAGFEEGFGCGEGAGEGWGGRAEAEFDDEGLEDGETGG